MYREIRKGSVRNSLRDNSIDIHLKETRECNYQNVVIITIKMRIFFWLQIIIFTKFVIRLDRGKSFNRGGSVWLKNQYSRC